MSDSGFALFETPIGRCGIAWGPGGICGLQLPEADDRAAAARLRRRFPTLAPGRAARTRRRRDHADCGLPRGRTRRFP